MIIEAPDVPYTFNMKKVESAVSNILNGRPVTNRDALINAESLDFYEETLPKLQKEQQTIEKLPFFSALANCAPLARAKLRILQF